MGIFDKMHNFLHEKKTNPEVTETFNPEYELENHHNQQNNISEPNPVQDSKNFICDACGKTFETELDLEYHLKTQPEVHEYYDDKFDLMVKAETEEEKMFWDQQESIRKLNEIEIPVSKNCSVCGWLDYPPFEGRDGKYYCRYHILPENRGNDDRGKPLSGSPGSIVYHSDGKTEFKL